ncbi:DUF4332 domain-containing protein [Kaustia mangrovi]|uniref:DUF4332 domain-containing protein n=1 Tax=Kaustia mangrovi TaxID=2593653 RepID=UPI0031B5E6C2
MSYSIARIEGIGPSYARLLKGLGIHTTNGLLERCADRKGRRALSEETGLSETVIQKWTNMADLMRIHGIGEEYSELLEAAGVDTVKELRHRNALNLALAMAEANIERRLVRQPPGKSGSQAGSSRPRRFPPS